MKRVILTGALGRMGRMVAEEISLDDAIVLAGAVESAGHDGLGTSLYGIEITADLDAVIAGGDILVDFTKPDAAAANILRAAVAGKPAITGTTGMTPAQLAEVEKASQVIPLLISPNMSLGVNLMFKLVGETASALPDFDAEVVEIHHNRKKDSPSGTAARIADVLTGARPDSTLVHGRSGMLGERKSEEIGIHSLRGGDVTGEHTIVFAGQGERLEITHRAHSRRTFARGTIRAIHFMLEQKPGIYTMADVLGF